MFLLSNFDLKEDVGEQGKALLKHRKYLKAVFNALLWVILSCGKVLFGQTVYSTSQLLQPLNDTGGSARAMAMGSAFVGVADDSSALLWNPAGLGTLSQGELALHHNSWLVGTLEETLIGVVPLNDMGGIGAMVNYMNYGTFQGRDYTGALTTPYSVNNYGFMVGWGKEWTPGFSAGVAFQGNLQDGPNQSYGLLSGDFGVLYCPDNHLRFGAALINFGANQVNAWVASTIEAGASFRTDFSKLHSLLLAVDGTLEPQGVNRLGIGAEYAFQSSYFLRAGFQIFDQNNEIQGLQELTAGVGVRLGDFQLDYAYLPYGDLGTSNRISLSYLFPSAKPIPPIETKPAAAPASSSPPAATFKPNPGTGPNQNVLTLQFDVPSDLVAQGQTLEAQGNTVEAMSLYQEEIKQNGQDAMAWWYLGNDYYKLGQKAYAVQCFEEVRKLKPGDKAFSDWLEQYKAQKP